VWLSDAPHAVTIIDQAYEFAIGEWVSRFEFAAEGCKARVEVLIFQESAPLPGSASWHEDHVSLDVARAFAFHADVTGDLEYLRESAWPILSGVANWITSRVTKTARGYEIRAAMGIAERETEVDNAAFTNMAAVVVLRDAIQAAERLGRAVNSEWIEIAGAIALPIEDGAIVSHDGFKPDEDKGGTPDPLMGIFPLGFGMDPGRKCDTEVVPGPARWLYRKSDALCPLRRLAIAAWCARSTWKSVATGTGTLLQLLDLSLQSGYRAAKISGLLVEELPDHWRDRLCSARS